MFQKAIKRHPIWMNYRIAVDRETLKFQSFVADLDLDGGGRRNYSVAITQVASGGCVGVYYFPRNDIAGVGHASRAPQSASMRGFGATEVQLGTEVIVDELAHELGVDPMDLRLANILQTGDRNCAGKVPLCHSRMKEIIEYDRALPVWADREKRKAEFEAENPAFRYGVGYAIMKKGFGNSNEAVLAAIELSAEGKIRLHHIGVEMGTGIVGSQVLRCSHWFGRPADEVATQAIDWSPLELYETMSPFVMDRAYQDKMKQDPHWVTSFSSATSATNGAFYFTHATDQAALFVRDYGLLPAAAEIWQVSREDVDQASWQDGDLVLEGKDPLTLEVLAQKAHEMGGVTGAMIHCFDRWGWAEADYDILGQKTRRQVDALAIRVAGGDWQRIERENVFYTDPMVVNSSWSRYTPMSALVELTVNRGTGEVNLLSHHTTADCGRIMVPEFVSGQIQGAIGQAVGIALYEGLPLYEGGPGTGHWNFNRYRMPRARNVGVWNHSAHFLEMSADEPYPKGVAEVALGPTVGAIANAVAHAIGSYIRELPITEDKIMEVLA